MSISSSKISSHGNKLVLVFGLGDESAFAVPAPLIHLASLEPKPLRQHGHVSRTPVRVPLELSLQQLFLLQCEPAPMLIHIACSQLAKAFRALLFALIFHFIFTLIVRDVHHVRGIRFMIACSCSRGLFQFSHLQWFKLFFLFHMGFLCRLLRSFILNSVQIASEFKFFVGDDGRRIRALNKLCISGMG